MSRDPKSDVLQVRLSRYHSLDLVRLPTARRYRVVLAERFGVQRRAFVEISFEEAHRVALFLASVDDRMGHLDPDDQPTMPARPSNMPPVEVQEMVLQEYLDRDLPTIDDEPRRTRSVAPTVDLGDPRTGAFAIVPEDDHED